MTKKVAGAKRGRPPGGGLPDDQRRDQGRISFRCSLIEAEQIRANAAAAGLPVAEWIRRRALGESCGL